MPSPSLKIRTEDRNRNRLKRYEPDRGRYRLRRYEPSYPIAGLFPASPCPHPESIDRPGFLCGCRECVNHREQIAIDRSTAPVPINPEDRALRKIEEYRAAMQDLDPIKHPRLLAGLQAKIDEQREIINMWAGVPTAYKPDPKLRGGRS